MFIFGFILLIGLNTISVRKKFKKKTEKALNNYSMLPDDLKITDKAILGRGNNKLRPGAVSLICTNRKNISLFIQDSRTRKEEGPGGSGTGKFEAYNSSNRQGSKVDISNMTPLSRGYFYTYMSDPLSDKEVTAIVKILEIEGLSGINIYTFDGNDNFNSKFNISKVKKLINNCHS